MKKLFTAALLAVTLMGGLAGCPPKDVVLDVYGWVVDSADDVVNESWLDDNDDIDVPNGGAIILNFSSAQRDVEFVSGTVKLRGDGKTETHNLMATTNAGKTFEPSDLGWVALAGAVAVATIDAVDNGNDDGQGSGNGESRKGFEVTIEMLSNVDSVDVDIETNIGSWNTTLWNSGGEVPAEGETGDLTIPGNGQPQNQTVTVGSRVTFTVAPVNTTGHETYQWYHNSIALTLANWPDLAQWSSGWNTNTLVIFSVGIGDSNGIGDNRGGYYCVVNGILTSDTATLTINPQGSTEDDTTPPVITLNGASPVNLTVGASWSDPGATANDAVDGARSVTVSGTVNTATAGTYVLTYTASDASGNTATAMRTVIVGDVTPPPAGVAVAFTSSGNNLSAVVNTDWLATVSAKPSGITNVRLVLYYPTENGYPSAPWEASVDVATNGNTTVNIPSTAIRTNTSGQAIARMAMEVRNGTTATWVDIGRTISTFNGATTPINNGAWQKTL